MSDATRVIHIKKNDGTSFNVTIPVTAVITYGHLHPGSKTGPVHGGGDDRYVLRVYEGSGATKRQTAVFRGVDQFVDGSYEISIDEASVFPDSSWWEKALPETAFVSEDVVQVAQETQLLNESVDF